MNPRLPEEAVELGAVAERAFAERGGVDLARRAEADPAIRAAEVTPVLDALGLTEIDPREGGVALAAAAAVCAAAGRVALPHPLAASLVRDADGRPTAVVPGPVARVDHGELFPEWRALTLDGAASVVRPAPGRALGTRLGPFVTDLVPAVLTDEGTAGGAPVGQNPEGEATGPARGLLTEEGTAGGAQVGQNRGGGSAQGRDVDLVLTLGAWTVLGTVERAVELAVEHVSGRVQFGKPLSAFQAVQFQLADAAVAAAGLRELAGFTLWRLEQDPGRALADVLALRVHALEVARAVLRTSQQLHGAAGVCDEYDVSVLTRMVQPALRLPFGAERSATELAAAIERDGFAGLFPHGGGST